MELELEQCRNANEKQFNRDAMISGGGGYKRRLLQYCTRIIDGEEVATGTNHSTYLQVTVLGGLNGKVK